MKVDEIIEETTARSADIVLDFNDLSSLQIGALRAINDGRLDFENATERMMEVIDELQDFNLIDPAYSLTPMGEKAMGLALSIGGAERRAAALKAQKQQDYNPDEDIYNDIENDFDDDDWSDHEMRTYGGAHPNQ